MSEGIIYITRTPQDKKNYYKVGRTIKGSTEERTRHEATYISDGIETKREFRVSNVEDAEKAAHKALAYCHVKDTQQAKEIFCEDLDILIGKVKEAILSFLLESDSVDNRNKNKWILDFIHDYRYTFDYHSHSNNINSIIELMNRATAKNRGAGPDDRIDPPKTLKDLLKNSPGQIIESTLIHIDHESLVAQQGWEDAIRTISFLQYFFHPKKGKEKPKQGLSDFNINEVLVYWCDKYFDLNPKLMLGCLRFILDKNDYANFHEFEFTYLPLTRKKILRKAYEYCKKNTQSKDIIKQLYVLSLDHEEEMQRIRISQTTMENL